MEQSILIVDDDKSNRKILKDLLQEQAKIIFAKNGMQAIELAKKHLPDLILLDVIMPDLSGFEVIDVIKKTPETMNISVIFITGLANNDDEAKGFDLGGCDYIYKPFKPNIVIARVMMHLELINQRKILHDIAHLDALTGVFNRRQMDVVLKDEVVKNQANEATMMIALIDIDFFKLYNDNYGHGAGDIALKQVATALKEACTCREYFVARYGGEEFVVIFPNCNMTSARELIEKMMQAIHLKAIKHEYSNVAEQLTLSIGAVLLNGKNSKLTELEALNKADELLYDIKSNGRNRINIVPLN
ncbi:diguanylate cyclase [Colwellia sp. RE-S-Sl-9]